jgi:hypothetical protein
MSQLLSRSNRSKRRFHYDYHNYYISCAHQINAFTTSLEFDAVSAIVHQASFTPMDKKARILKLACVLLSLEVAFMVASLVTGAIPPSVDPLSAHTDPSVFWRVSNWLMLCQNALEIGFYAIFAWLLAADNRSYAIAGFLSVLIGLAASSLCIVIELELMPGTYQPTDPFGIGYATIDSQLGLIGIFSILPANGFFAMATLRDPQRRPIVPAVLFIGLPVGLITLFIPDDATGWQQFLGDWMVPLFVVCKQLIILWWFLTLLNPGVVRERSSVRTLADGLLGGGVPMPVPLRSKNQVAGKIGTGVQGEG